MIEYKVFDKSNILSYGHYEDELNKLAKDGWKVINSSQLSNLLERNITNKWEYETFYFKADSNMKIELNKLGWEKWELVGVSSDQYGNVECFLKREIQ